MIRGIFSLLVISVMMTASASVLAQEKTEMDRQARAILQQLIEINTTDSVGNVTAAAEAMAKRLRDAGFPETDIQVLGPNDRKKNMVARLHGTGKHRPVLLIGPGRGRSTARGLDYRSLPVRRERRLLLRTRHPGHEERRRDHGDHAHADEAGRIPAGSGHHPGTDSGRRGREVERGGLAAQEPPPAD